MKGASIVFGSVKYFGDGRLEGKEAADNVGVEPAVNGRGKLVASALSAAAEFKIDG